MEVGALEAGLVREFDMSLAALTDPSAVDRAIKEFDRLTRARFLDKHGYGVAKDYFVVRDGQLYDSKAIAGVAHGFQHPKLGPLGPYDFGGGERTVATRLRKLGFVVTKGPQAIRGRVVWAFCANPKRYDIDKAILDAREDLWVTDGKDLRRGDIAIVWRTRGVDKRRGIVALATVVSDPLFCDDGSNPYWRKQGEGQKKAARVAVKYSVPVKCPMWVDSTRMGKSLMTLAVAKAQGGTVFYVSPEQWEMIRTTAEWNKTTEEDEVEVLVRPRARGGQGMRLTHAERVAVEMRAMAVVEACLKKDWPLVTDVSMSRSYDFECKRGRETFRVEVKGTTTAGDTVLLTHREVAEASNNEGYGMFVVSDIRLDQSDPSKVRASGGRCRRLFPWNSSVHKFQPVTYSCTLNWSSGEEILIAES